MTTDELFRALTDATSYAEVVASVDAFTAASPQRVGWLPVGGRHNNRGTIEAAADPGRSLVERVTNGIDAVLELEHERHGGRHEVRTPREAAAAWLNVPESGLSDMTVRARQQLGERVVVTVHSGDTREARVVEIRDHGVGIPPDQMHSTILSLNESNKMSKHYLAGAYGQGGSSTFAVSTCSFLASRRDDASEIGFTVVKYRDLPPEDFKIGHYVYLTVDGVVPRAIVSREDFSRGSLVKHFGYDLTNYSSSRGPRSVYGLLNQVLFDPVLPVWLENRVHNYRRIIKGARNALNGAVDEGDEDRRGPNVAHKVPMFFVSLGESGRIGVEYWVLPAPTLTNKRPTESFVNPNKPIVLTLNGQNQAELSQILIRKDAELPYLAQRVICHIDCNSLTPAALRALFVSNREDVRRGALLDQIKQELMRVLKSDDELIRLNSEARERGVQERDESSVLEARRAVARLLRLQGLNVSDSVGGVVANVAAATDRPTHPRPPRPRPEPLELHDPPTFIRLIWDDSRPLTFYPEQRRYVRIETDAPSTYHNANTSSQSRINIIVSDGEVAPRGSTPLQGGRMRAIFDCIVGARVGGEGIIRVELSRPGLPVLVDERPFGVVEPPPVRSDRREVALPPFDIRPIDPGSDKWLELGWPDDVASIASSAELESNELVVYYNPAFPKYLAQYNTLERKDPAIARSFKARYEIWLVVHSLLFHNQQQPGATSAAEAEGDDSQQTDFERTERIRIATLSTMFAAREVQLGESESVVEVET